MQEKSYRQLTRAESLWYACSVAAKYPLWEQLENLEVGGGSTEPYTDPRGGERGEVDFEDLVGVEPGLCTSDN